MTTPDDENHNNNEKPALEKERVFELNASLACHTAKKYVFSSLFGSDLLKTKGEIRFVHSKAAKFSACGELTL